MTLVGALALAGCASPDRPAAIAKEAAGSLPIAPSTRTVIADAQGDVIYEADVECTMGGGPIIKREDALIATGTDHLEINTTVDPTFSGLQVGYAIDHGDKTWLPVVRSGAQTQNVRVEPANVEIGGQRWEFYYQLNLPLLPQACYTGVGTGHRAIHIEAVPAGGSPPHP